ncbi:MAG: T9SS type A sorting domain-containing protein [Saprospiraceae bacterium]
MAFRNFGHWGNNMFLDNININGNAVKTLEGEHENIALYPNPAIAGCDFNIKTDGGEYYINIYDSNGSKILSTKIDEKKNIISLPSNIVSGVYLINIEGENLIANRKLVIIGN